MFFAYITYIITYKFFNTHMRREKKVLKKLIVVYIQKGLTLGYTVHVINFFNSHSFSNVGLTHYFFF